MKLWPVAPTTNAWQVSLKPLLSCRTARLRVSSGDRAMPWLGGESATNSDTGLKPARGAGRSNCCVSRLLRYSRALTVPLLNEMIATLTEVDGLAMNGV